MDATEPYWWQVNIRKGNSLAPLDNKPLPEPVLVRILNAIWRHYALIS